jgi:hypothetical protein
LLIVLEALVFPVNLQPWPQRHGPGIDVNFMSRKMLQQPVEHIVEDWDVPDLGTHLLLRSLPAEPV